MKINWCKVLGHIWIPTYTIGWFGGTEVKFIATECKRCKVGENDLYETIQKMNNCSVCSYNEKYYYKK